MPDLRKYWQEIRAIENSLPAEVWLMSLENRSRGQVAGSMAQVGAATAATLLYAKSQRLATDEEILAHQARQVANRRQAFDQRLRNEGIAIIPLESRPK